MQKINPKVFSAPALFVAVMLTGCASEPPAPAPTAEKILSGDQMLRDSQGIAQLGSRWQEGKRMVEDGQALQREGQIKIDKGRAMIEEGQKIMHETEEGYKSLKN